MSWGTAIVDWTIKYVLRERRIVVASTSSLPLLNVAPSWRELIRITYQDVPITGLYFHRIEFHNRGNRSVKDLPFQVTVSTESIILWPLSIPSGALTNLLQPIHNQMTAQVGFINPKETVEVSFWALNDTVGIMAVSARAPDVEFKTEPWQPPLPPGFRFGVVLHKGIFWIGSLVVLSLLGYGGYRGAFTSIVCCGRSFRAL